MKLAAKLSIITLLVAVLAVSSFAGKKNRKLSVGAYISSAKIEIISGDMERYETAISYLDSLFYHYGPHAEGLYLMGQIMVDYLDKTPDMSGKLEYVKRLVAYGDSLHMCCENQDIKKKYRKDCDEYTELADSVKVRYWREFYNAGIEQLKTIDELQTMLASASDSSDIERVKGEIQATVDSCVTTLQMVTILNENDHRGYVGLGQAYDKSGDYQNAITWISKGLEAIGTEDSTGNVPEGRPSLLFSLAYYNIQLDDFCGAIPYFKEYTEIFPDDTSTLYNLAACYNNCKFFDSALAVNHQILQHAPQNLDALIAIGLFHNERARHASDTISKYQKEENQQQVDAWRTKREDAFDSSIVYFKRAVEGHPESVMALEQYGTITAIRGQYAEAVVMFDKLAELEPYRCEYWRSVGDFRLRLQEFDKATAAYEKTVECDPSDAETWERLADLYHNDGKADLEAAARKKIDELN